MRPVSRRMALILQVHRTVQFSKSRPDRQRRRSGAFVAQGLYSNAPRTACNPRCSFFPGPPADAPSRLSSPGLLVYPADAPAASPPDNFSPLPRRASMRRSLSRASTWRCTLFFLLSAIAGLLWPSHVGSSFRCALGGLPVDQAGPRPSTAATSVRMGHRARRSEGGGCRHPVVALRGASGDCVGATSPWVWARARREPLFLDVPLPSALFVKGCQARCMLGSDTSQVLPSVSRTPFGGSWREPGTKP